MSVRPADATAATFPSLHTMRDSSDSSAEESDLQLLFPKEASPQARALVRDESFLKKTYSKEHMKMLRFQLDSSFFAGEVSQQLLEDRTKVDECVRKIEHPNCLQALLQHPALLNRKVIVLAVVFGVLYIIGNSIPSDVVTFEGSPGWASALVITKVFSSTWAVFSALSILFKNYTTTTYSEPMALSRSRIAATLESERTRIGIVAVSLTRDWINSSPCHERPTQLTKMEKLGLLSDQANKQALRVLILKNVDTFEKAGKRHLKESLARFLSSEKEVISVIGPFLDAVNSIRLDTTASFPTEAEEIALLDENSMLPVLHFLRSRQERRFRERLDNPASIATSPTRRNSGAGAAGLGLEFKGDGKQAAPAAAPTFGRQQSPPVLPRRSPASGPVPAFAPVKAFALQPPQGAAELSEISVSVGSSGGSPKKESTLRRPSSQSPAKTALSTGAGAGAAGTASQRGRSPVRRPTTPTKNGRQ
ncbi:MAG: hypothetical protein HYX48_05175 [Chlamydiales bacterium]|nr:hypothetical protein [Chlamydiales bacterium]